MSVDATSMGALREASTSFSEVVELHFDDVYRIVQRQLGPMASRDEVEDVVQLALMAAFRAWPSFRGDSKVTTWLYGVATRVVLTQLRSWRRHRRLLKAFSLELPPEGPCPARAVEQRDELARVWRCLLKIKPQKRMVYVMFVVEELPGDEIAERLEIPVATVWSRLRTARRELARHLAREERKEPS